MQLCRKRRETAGSSEQMTACMSSRRYIVIETHLRLSPQWRSLELLNGHELQALE